MSTGQIGNLSPEVLVGIKSLLVRARTVVEGALVGEHVSPFRGGSVEFAQHRSYSPGDELRYIDWRLFARTDNYHVKQFEVTTNLRAYLLLDASGSMDYPLPAQGVSKFQYGAMLAAAFAYTLIRQSDSVALSTHGEKGVLHLPPRSQVAYIQQICDVIDAVKPRGDQDIMGLLQHAQDRIVHRGMVVMFSDFLVDVDALMAKVRILKSRGHDLIVFQILHSDELDFPFNRFYRFESLEDNRFLVADSKQIRAQYMEALQEHQERLGAAMRKIGVDYHIVRTDQQPSKVLAACLNGPMRAQKLRKMY